MQIRSVDCDSIETALRNDYPDITWVSAEISGTRLIVHIKENDGIKEDIQTDSTPRDIVATCSGVVTSMITRAGTPKVKPGDEVEKGQILVSGIVDVYNDAKEVVNQRPVSADADIFVRVDIPYEEHLPYLYEYKEYTGRKKTRWLFGIADSRCFMVFAEAGGHCDGQQSIKAYGQFLSAASYRQKAVPGI